MKTKILKPLKKYSYSTPMDNIARLGLLIGQIRELSGTVYNQSIVPILPHLQLKLKDVHDLISERFDVARQVAELHNRHKEEAKKLDRYANDCFQNAADFLNSLNDFQRTDGLAWTVDMLTSSHHGFDKLPGSHIYNLRMDPRNFFLTDTINEYKSMNNSIYIQSAAARLLFESGAELSEVKTEKELHDMMDSSARFWSPDFDIPTLDSDDLAFMEGPPLSLLFGSTKQIPEDAHSKSKQYLVAQVTLDYFVESPGKLGKDVDVIVAQDENGRKNITDWLQKHRIEGVTVYLKEDFEKQQ